MKIYAIRDEAIDLERDLAWLFYDPFSTRFYIELPEKTDPWQLPPPLDVYAAQGVFTLSSGTSLRWVEERIVPADRQNLGMILKENKLRYYEPFRLWLLADGRCAQDDCFLVSVSTEELPKQIQKRLQEKVLDVTPLSKNRVLVLFRDDVVRMVDIAAYSKKETVLRTVCADKTEFERVRVSPLGNGIEWDERRQIMTQDLRTAGEVLPLTAEDLLSFTKNRTLDTKDATELLRCSRQYVNKLIAEDRLHPIRGGKSGTLFLRREVEQLIPG